MRGISQKLYPTIRDERVASNTLEWRGFIWMFGIISTPARLILPPIRIEMTALKEDAWL
jgi:hypothetical protein